MSRRIVWLRALAAGSVGIAVVGLWAGVTLWQRGDRRGGTWTAVLGVLFCAVLLGRLRQLAVDERGRTAAAARPPAAAQRLRRAGRWAGFLYDAGPLLLLPPVGVVSLIAAARMLAARAWSDALFTFGVAAFLGGYGTRLLLHRARRAGLLGGGS